MLQVIMNDKQYRLFIKYALTICDSFSLVFEKSDEDKTKYIFQEFYDSIAEFILEKKTIECHPVTGTCYSNSDIIYCRYNKNTIYILQIADNIFDWNGQNLPEELCFYKNNKVWFSCIYHERLLFIYNETKNDIDFLKKSQILF